MLHLEPSADRAKLGFAEAVVANFGFLSEIGFVRVETKMTFVKYCSAQVFINIYHGRASYEMNVEIGRVTEPTRTLSISDVLKWSGTYEDAGFGRHVMFQVSTRDGVFEFVPRLASLVRSAAMPLLENKASAWKEALELQQRRWEEYVAEVNDSAAREKAELAWQSKDMAETARLYRSMKGNLTDVELRRLDYAEDHTVSTNAGQTDSQKQSVGHRYPETPRS